LLCFELRSEAEAPRSFYPLTNQKGKIMTTAGMIREWLTDGKELKATHCIVVCDTFDHEDYPVYVSKKQNVREIMKKYDGINMQRVMEVYNLRKPLEKQLEIRRNFEF
jgi:hypothetical protein